MIETTVTLSRNAVAIQSGIAVQIDEKNPMMAAYYNNAHPYDVFDLYIKYAPASLAVLRGDLLTDEKNIDPETSRNTLYRAVGRPQKFPDGHIEAVVNQFVGPV